ncbi:class I SAM-dependent methyltransferase [Nocardia crassostreae]|uniref:class I SAM-dependent methyltransferase n=1 Tax=Nocardia crassostreae TaxID=53428 RepID=UPI000ABD62C5|nr:class I SAM-dependent methyltransferase [Nocardia crassostreae]
MPAPLETRLLDNAALECSSVVANNAMNRGRGLSGVNSYTRELGFNPYDRLAPLLRATPQHPVHWIDVCCGSGRALLEAEHRFAADFPAADITITRIDLVDHFQATPRTPHLRLITANAATWHPDTLADLITCVHGLHYIGDKLSLLSAMTQWTSPGASFAADFDPHSIRHPNGSSAARKVLTELRAAGLTYDIRRHRLSGTDFRPVTFTATYLGADDAAGPGYTGQPAVASYYDFGSRAA